MSSTGFKALLEIKPDQIFKCAISLVMLVVVILTISGIIRGPAVSSMKQQYWDFQFSLYKKYYILFHFQTFFWFPKMMIDSRHGFFFSLDNSEERERLVSSILLGVYKRTVIFRGGAKTSRCLCLQLPFRKEEDLFGKIHHFMNMGRLGSPPT